MKKITPIERERLDDIAYEVRRQVIELVCTSGWGHIGGSLSLSEILSVLYFYDMYIDPKSPQDAARDRLILSKAHCSPALYSTLALRGFFPVEQLDSYCFPDGIEGHLTLDHPAGVENCGGSLGVGLSYAAGLAYALKMDEQFASRVFCIVGDGECCEGQIWEAAMFAGHNHLDNLICIVDYNKVMAKGFVQSEMCAEPVRNRWESFGWNVLEVDGHDVDELVNAFYQARYVIVGNAPVCIVANTVKGHGVTECEFNYKWHTHAPSVEQANQFLEAHAARYKKDYMPIKSKVPRPDNGSLQAVIGG